MRVHGAAIKRISKEIAKREAKWRRWKKGDKSSFSATEHVIILSRETLLVSQRLVRC